MAFFLLSLYNWKRLPAFLANSTKKATIKSSLKDFSVIFSTLFELLFGSLSRLASQANSEMSRFCDAPLQSGALITANFALEQGRDVFGVPNSIYSPGSVGVNKLIQDGAHLVTNVQDILMVLNLFLVPQHIEIQAALPDNNEERTLLALLSHDPLHIDELIRESGLPTTTVAATLMVMELKGMIKQFGGMQYVLAR